jgi:hypothetical protein
MFPLLGSEFYKNHLFQSLVKPEKLKFYLQSCICTYLKGNLNSEITVNRLFERFRFSKISESKIQ